MGAKQPIDRIAYIAPVPSILTSARRLPGGDWSTGIAWTPSLCVASSVWEWCPPSSEPAAEKTTNDVPAGVATEPFTVYTPVDCVWVTTEAGERLEALVTEATEVHTARAVARALWLGEGLTDIADDTYGLPPTLRRSATDVTPGGVPAVLDNVVAILLAAYDEATGGAGGATLHIPTALITGALGGTTGGGRVCWPEGNLYRGPCGSVVSPGPGYPDGPSANGADGFGPLVDDDPEVYAGNGYDEAWVYVSGPVEYDASPVMVLPESDADRRINRRNTFEVIAERQAIVRVDPCGVFAARAINDSGQVS